LTESDPPEVVAPVEPQGGESAPPRGRSRILIVTAVCLILGGGWSAWTMLGPALLGGQIVRASAIDAQFRQAEAMASARTEAPFTEEQRTHLRAVVEQTLVRLQQILDHPGVRTDAILTCALGLAACVAGIGLLARMAWGVSLAIAQAVAAVAALAVTWSSRVWAIGQLIELVGLFAPDDAARQQIVPAFSQIVHVASWSSAVSTVLWSGWVVWALTRPRVRAEFTSVGD
jgi:hypothetical protein